jgi:hypothetical protein
MPNHIDKRRSPGRQPRIRAMNSKGLTPFACNRTWVQLQIHRSFAHESVFQQLQYSRRFASCRRFENRRIYYLTYARIILSWSASVKATIFCAKASTYIVAALCGNVSETKATEMGRNRALLIDESWH